MTTEAVADRAGTDAVTEPVANADIEVVTIVRGRAAHLRKMMEGLSRSSTLPTRLTVVRMEQRLAAPGAGHQAAADTELPFAVRFLWCPPTGTSLPLAAARNLGVTSTESDRVILLDVDCIPGRTLVGTYAAALARHDAFVLGTVRYLEPDAVRPDWTERDLLARSSLHPARPQVAEPGPVEDHRLFWSLSFAVRRTTFERLGGFDERFVGYGGEDTDLGFAAHTAGVPLRWEPRAVAYHQHHAVHDPPLQHFADIVTNARRFRDKWGVWPMEGWLRAFADRGLVAWDPDGDRLEILGRPSPADIAATRRTR